MRFVYQYTESGRGKAQNDGKEAGFKRKYELHIPGRNCVFNNATKRQ